MQHQHRPALLLAAFTFMLAGCVHAPNAAVHRPSAVEFVAAPTSPANYAQQAPVRIAIIADLNGPYGSTTYGPHVHAAVERIVAMKPDIVLTAGDMVAGQKAGLDYAGMWAGFHGAVTNELDAAGIPLAVAPGNHDASGYRNFADEREVYRETWQERRPEVQFVDDTGYPFYYAFVIRDVLFVALDATTTTKLPSAQRRWLRGVLERNRHYTTKVVYGHVPLYPFAEGRESQAMHDPELEDMLNEHHVSLIVSGHHHAYYPGRRGALRMVGTGCLGSGVRTLIGTDTPSVRTVVVVEAGHGGIESLEALTGERFVEPVERASLPVSIGRAPFMIFRDDVFPGREPARVVGRVASLARGGRAAPGDDVAVSSATGPAGAGEADAQEPRQGEAELSTDSPVPLLRVLERRQDPRVAMDTTALIP